MLIKDENVCSLKNYMIYEKDFEDRWNFEKAKVPSILDKFNMNSNDELELVESFEICDNGDLLVKMELNNTPIYLIRLTISQGNWGYLH